MNDTEEQWRPVSGWEGQYEVSDQGRIRSLDRVVTDRTGLTRVFRGRHIKPYAKDSGHLQVTLPDRRKYKVHHIVLTAFVGARPPGLVGCHNDGDPANNYVGNLRWDTQTENMRDIVRHGVHNNANKTHCPKGHRYTERDRLNTRNVRRCLACASEYSRMKRSTDRNKTGAK